MRPAARRQALLLEAGHRPGAPVGRHDLQQGVGVDHGARWFAQLVGLKVRATESARTVVDLAVRVSGGGSYGAGSELSRLYRDVLAGMFHPSDDESAHATLASSVLGPLRP